MPISASAFRPIWWLRNRHLQTIWPALYRRAPMPLRYRQRLSTQDDDFLDVDWLGAAPNPIVLLLHGLTGSANSGYILGMQQALLQSGFRSIALNFRGCSGQPNRSARCYHSGDTSDLDFLVHRLKRCEPLTPLAAIGFSLGGNVLLKWLGESGEQSGLFAAAAVSVPMQLAPCADRLDKGLSRLYRNRLLAELKLYITQKRRHLDQAGLATEAGKLHELGDLSDIRSFWQYDDRVVARLYGFKDVHDYYRQAGCRPYLSAIRTPTLIIQALDDPFMTPDVLPQPEELPPAIALEISRYGGHVGFVSSTPTGGIDYWLERRIPHFLRERLADGNEAGIAPYHPHLNYR